MEQEAGIAGDLPPASLLRMVSIGLGISEESVIQWAAILESNLYSTVESLRHVSAEEWAAMKIPMRVRTEGRRIAFPAEDDEQTIKSLLSQIVCIEDAAAKVDQKKKKKLSIGSSKSVGKAETRRSRSGSISHRHTSDQSEGDKTPRDRLAEFRRSSQGKSSASHATGLLSADSSKPRSTSTVHSLVSPPASPQPTRKSLTRPKSVKMRRKSIDHSKDKVIRSAANMTPPAVVHVAGDRGMVNTFLGRVDTSSGPKGKNSNLKEVTCSVPANGEMAKVTFQASFSLMPDQLLEEAAMTVFVFSVLDPRSLNSLLLQYMTTFKHSGPGFPQLPVAVIGMDAEHRKVGDRSHVAIDQANQAKQQLSGFAYFDVDDSAPSLWSVVYEIARTVNGLARMKNSPKYAACETKLLKCHEAKDTEIILKKLELEVLPPTIVYMASHLQRLRLPHNNLRSFPLQVLLLPSLLELDLSENTITSVPRELSALKKLAKLDLRHNKLENVPLDALRDMNSLVEVRLKGNPLRDLSSSFLKKKDLLIMRAAPPRSDTQPSSGDDNSSSEPGTPAEREVPVFGSKLDDLLSYDQECFPELSLQVPLFAKKCLLRLLSLGATTAGIFRLEGNSGRMVELRNRFEAGEPIQFAKSENANNVAGLFKLWLRSLPQPLLCNHAAWLSVADASDDKEQLAALQLAFNDLPASNKVLLQSLCRVLYMVFSNSATTKMDVSNLARVVATNILWEKANKRSTATDDVLAGIARAQKAVERLLEKSLHFIGDDCSPDPLGDVAAKHARFYRKLAVSSKALTAVFVTPDEESPRVWTGDEKGVLTLWDAKTLSKVAELEGKHRVNCIIAVDANVWVGTIANIQVRDARDGSLIQEVALPGYNLLRVGKFVWCSLFRNSQASINTVSVKVIPSLASLHAASPDRGKTGRVKKEWIVGGSADMVTSLIRVGDRVWGACQRTVRVWDTATCGVLSELESGHTEDIVSLRLIGTADEPKQVWCLSSDGCISSWNVKSFQSQRTATGSCRKLSGGCPMGKQCWAYSWDADISMWNSDLCKESVWLRESFHSQPISGMASTYSPGATEWFVYTVSFDRSMVVWKVSAMSAP